MPPQRRPSQDLRCGERRRAETVAPARSRYLLECDPEVTGRLRDGEGVEIRVTDTLALLEAFQVLAGAEAVLLDGIKLELMLRRVDQAVAELLEKASSSARNSTICVNRRP